MAYFVMILKQLYDDLDLCVVVLDRDHSQYVSGVLGIRVFTVLVCQHQTRICLLDLRSHFTQRR